MKQAWLDWLKTHDGVAITEAELTAICKGDFDGDDEDMQAKAEFVWYHLFGANYAHSYPKKLRAHLAPNDVKLSYDNESPLMTAANRAIIVAMCENCREKWQNIYEWKQKNPGKPVPPRPTKTQYEGPEKAQYLPLLKLHDAKWTSSTRGQQTYSSWVDTGLDYFIAKKEEISEFMENHAATIAANEDKVLKAIQVAKKMVNEDGDVEPQPKRQKVATKGKKCGGLAYASDSDEE